MSRPASPGPPPAGTYSESSHVLASPSAYYDGSEQRPLMSDEMMEDISRITEAVQHPGLSNGQQHVLPIMQSETATSSSARPVTPQNRQQSVPAQQQQYTTDAQAGEGYGDGTNRRKRSKVSRACDECRRKKIRCDATKDDGTVETCSNCKRISATCAFSRVPMKRGPSKGYIKELSERVQQVESQMETQRSMSQMGPPLGFRGSLDGRGSMDSTSGGLFEGTYSPTSDPMSKKRTFSAMSDGAVGASPFSSFLYRDRMPSTAGGWGSNSAPRDSRFSIAIAPDQLPDIALPPLSASLTSVSDTPRTPRSVRPFWTDVLSRDLGQVKPTGVEEIIEEEILPPLSATGYQHYLRHVHPVLPLLPGTIGPLEKHARECLTSSAQPYVNALRQALTLLRVSSDTTLQPPSSGELVDFIYTQARKHSRARSQSENFVLLWVCGLVYVSQENEVSRQKQTDKRYLVQLMVDISLFLVNTTDVEKPGAEDNDIDSEKNLARRIFNVVAIIARIYTLGSGTEDLIPDDDDVWSLIADGEDLSMLSDTTTVLARYCNHIAGVRLANALAPTVPREGRARALMNHKLLRQQVRDIKTKLPDPMSRSARDFTKQLDLLLNLIAARNLSKVNTYSVLQIFAHAEEIATYLAQRQADAMDLTDPLLPHLYVLASLTFLEFAAAPDSDPPGEDDAATLALKSLSELFQSLQRVQPLLRRPSLGGNGYSWATALTHLIVTQHPNIPLQTSMGDSTRPRSAAGGPSELGARLTDREDAPTSSLAPLNGLNGLQSEVATPKDTSASNMPDRAITPNPYPGQLQQQRSETTNEASSALQNVTDTVTANGRARKLSDRDLSGSLSAVEKAVNSPTWVAPDFSLLNKHGWMTVLAELVQ